MATFELTDQKGEVYEVDAPDEQSAVAAFKKMQTQQAQSMGLRHADFGNPTLNKIGDAIDTVMAPLNSFTDSATDMMALGGMDEATSALGTPLRMIQNQSWDAPEAFGQLLSEAEARRAALEADSPNAALAGKITGAVAGPAAMAGAKWVGQGASLGGRALRATVPGAVTGTVSGALATPGGVAERGEGAAWGMATGAALAPVAQVGGELVGRLIQHFRRGAQALPQVAQGQINDPMKAAVTRAPQPPQVSATEMDAGVRRLLDALKADGVNVDDVARLAASGRMDERTLAGLAGPNTRQMIDTYASMNGPAKTIVAGAQRAAEQGQGAAIAGATDRTLGARGDFLGAQGVLEGQMQAAGPLYEQAFANAKPVPIDQVMNKLDGEMATAKGGVRKALQSARDILLDAGGNPDATLQGLHNSKIALDDLYQAITKDNSMGNVARSKVLGVIKDLLGAMDSSNPGYATARDAFAGPAAVQDAMDLGRSILKDDWIGNAGEIAKLTTSEKQGLIEGTSQAVKDMIGSISDTADKAARLTNYAKYLDRIKAAFPSAQAFNQWKQALLSQSSEFSAIQMAAKGSQTAPRIADAIDQGAETAGTAMRAMTGDKFSLLQGGKDLIRWLQAPNAQARAAAVSAALAPVPQSLPMLSAVMQPPATAAYGAIARGGATYPASRARAMAEQLTGPR